MRLGRQTQRKHAFGFWPPRNNPWDFCLLVCAGWLKYHWETELSSPTHCCILSACTCIYVHNTCLCVSSKVNSPTSHAPSIAHTWSLVEARNGFSMSENKRAFVTGGGGYIGNCLCEALVARGYTVTAFDVRYLEEKRYNDSVHRVQVSPRG